jgi:hypothetical protein
MCEGGYKIRNQAAIYFITTTTGDFPDRIIKSKPASRYIKAC